MIATLAELTFRALLGRRRTILLVLAGVILVLVAAVAGLNGDDAAERRELTGRVLADLGLGVVVPLVAVIVGTAAIGSEIEDGTIIYLLAKPIPRWIIVLVKTVVVWLVTAALVVPAMIIAGIVGSGDADLGLAYAVGALVATIEYGAIFVALSVITTRALIIGLAYVVIWEGILAGLFAGTRVLSVRQHALSVADAVGGQGAVASELALATALIVGAVATALAVLAAVRALSDTELRGETA
ncbi:MAG TPA: ABC transporter permease subunit [Candidatus Limnocylindria bacterium]|nr:ABC transporter permease subunit [Candidatus Limnocylindria bacterium]